MPLPLPAWIEGVPERRRPAAARRFYLRLAALYATEAGTSRALATEVGINHNTLKTHVLCRFRPSQQLAESIERLLGGDLIPARLIGSDAPLQD